MKIRKSITIGWASVFIMGGLITVALQAESNAELAKISQLNAGACADCVPGGFSCSNQNSATNLAGTPCSITDFNNNVEKTSCDGQSGLRKKVGGTTWTENATDGSPNPCAVVEHVRCLNVNPGMFQERNLKWVSTSGGDCGLMATCEPGGVRISNDSRCKDKPKEP